MIFKTFDSNSDKVTSKIGVLGKSFEQIGLSIRQRKTEIDNLINTMSKKEAKNKIGSIGSYVFGDNSIKAELKDLSKFVELDDPGASRLLKRLREIELASKTNTSAWQKYFSMLNEGEKWQIEFVQNMDLQKTSTEDIIKASQEACASALAHNEALNRQTLGVQATQEAFQALSTMGNIFAMWVISKGIELAIKGIDKLTHSSEHCNDLSPIAWTRQTKGILSFS